MLDINTNPFPHVILDDFFDPHLINIADASWPQVQWYGWNATYNSENQSKLTCNQWTYIPFPCKKLLCNLFFFNISQFNLGSLIPDTGLWGSGMHCMRNGDFVHKHLDANIHALSGLARKLNAVLFLSDWQENWGGELVLGENKIKPKSNRLVLFVTNETSWHSVNKITCPHNVYRKTLTCWWYGPTEPDKLRNHAEFKESNI